MVFILLVPTRLPKYKTTNKLERIENLSNGVYIVMEKDSYIGIIMV